MKVVVFCGGLGVRMGEATQTVPKPMIRVGSRPILWHIMKWYASWGHTDFILCLGYQSESIKDYFLNYNEALANDFVLTAGQVELLGSDTDDWRVTFVDTGINTTLGERLKSVESHLAGESSFLVTYGDGLTDAPLDDMVRTLEESGKTGLFMAVRPPVEYHLVDADTRRRRPGRASLRRRRRLDQRRLLRLPTRDLRRDRDRGRARRFSLCPPDRTEGAPGVPLRGLLGGDGHDQGQAEARRDRRDRSCSVDSPPVARELTLLGLMILLGR